MLNIGEFARLGGVTVRTIRYYDQIGLLTPAHVATDTGYRRYRAAQLVDLQRIVALKELGVALDEIRELLADPSGERVGEVLSRRRAALEEELHTTQTRLAEIDRRLRRIERTGAMPDYEIIHKSLPAIRFVAIEAATPGVGAPIAGRSVEKAFTSLLAEIDRQAVRTTGDAFVVFDPAPSDEELTAYAALPVNNTVTAVPAPLAVYELSEVEHAVSVTRTVPDLAMYSEIYGELAVWMEDNGWEHVGNGRDIIVDVVDGVPRGWETQWPMRAVDGPKPDVTVRRLEAG